ncbi:MAG: CotH kinase family protein [Verrucomicrobiales bacterium]|nr:CotH kinase family protein [Verrucomicrobiales bacterium]
MQRDFCYSTDFELLRTFRKNGSAENFQPFLDRYLAFVFAAARRQSGTEEQAATVTRAVFLAFAKRARSLSRKTVLAGWFFHATRIAARKVRLDSGTSAPAPLPTTPSAEPPTRTDHWPGLAPLLDSAIMKLPKKLRDAFLVHYFCTHSWPETANWLRVRAGRAQKRVAKGTQKLARGIRKHGLVLDEEILTSLCAVHGHAAAPPEYVTSAILSAIPARNISGPTFKFARATLRALTWAKWRRWMKTALAGAGVCAVLLCLLGFALYLAWTKGPLLAWIIEWSTRLQMGATPELLQPARPWTGDPSHPQLNAAAIRTGDDLFRVTNVWPAHLEFSVEQWQAVAPKRIPPMPNMMPADGKFILRNPKARRSGLAGVLGYEFDWAHADLEFGGRPLSDVAARIKGNGTFLGSLWGLKRSFKVNLDKFNKDQSLGEVEVVNFTNLIEDRSYMADALGHEFFRDCGVPAPRTTYAYLDVSVAGQFERKPLGLYLVVENIDGAFAKNRFGNKAAPIFKPVTYQLFEDLGDDWSDYAAIYDLKTKATEAHRRRVVEFAKLLSHADDAEFARRLGEFLDYNACARFLAAMTLIASYDGFFSTGQNFYVYLDPRSNKFGFIPWDLDHSWGNFPFVGTAESRERASIWHPWVGDHRLLERVMGVEEFRETYRAQMEELLTTKFAPERLNRRIDEIAAAIRSAVAAESTFRLDRFEQAVSDKIIPRWTGEPFDGRRTAHQIKRFIAARARSVRAQLDGKSKGLVLDLMMSN